MRSVIQHLRDGRTEVVDVPAPSVRAGHVLIRTVRTLVSPGTERMLVGFGKANLLDKARQQPDKVRQVLQKVRTDGVLPTFDAVQAKLDQPVALGYCNAGVVIAVGAGVEGLSPGDGVVSNGPHAEVVCVPQRLVARIPEGVAFDDAAFTVLAAIALQSVRLLAPTLGERFTVVGLGAIGLLAVQILRAHGALVLGVDHDSSRCALARSFGAATVDLGKGEDPIAAAERWSGGVGVDGVLLAAATDSDAPAHQAAQMCRKRGRIVLVGVVGLALQRDDFYKKELSFQVSCSYGPGRYDPNYEERGQDYPLGFVRWTEQRNFEAILQLMAEGRLRCADLLSQSVKLADAPAFYARLADGAGGLAVLIEYEAQDEKLLLRQSIGATVESSVGAAPRSPARPQARIHVIGAGEHGTRVLLPALQRASAALRTLATRSGTSAVHAARKFGFARMSSDPDATLDDPDCDALLCTTRHDSHARYVIAAIERDLPIYVEKPLALNEQELLRIEAAIASRPSARVLVGFNRRFSPLVVQMMDALSGTRAPRSILITVNAGAIPRDHWIFDPKVGGGRLIGEGCHWVDLARAIAGTPIIGGSIRAARSEGRVVDDVFFVDLAFADGSHATFQYLANGNKGYPKERIEVFCGGRIVRIDNFQTLQGWGFSRSLSTRLLRQDKGHDDAVGAFIDAVRSGGPMPVPFAEAAEVTRWTFRLDAALRGLEPTTNV